MSSTWGNYLKLSLAGASHGTCLALIADGFHAGITLNAHRLERMMARRQGASTCGTTPRVEDDVPHFISGVYEGVTDGSPICCLIENKAYNSKDYQDTREVPRPSHADIAAMLLAGEHAQLAGGGHFSGRLSAPLVAMGSLALDVLETYGIRVHSVLTQVGSQEISTLKAFKDVAKLQPGEACALDESFIDEIKLCMENGESVGATVCCRAYGVPCGIGSAWFGGLESKISSIIYGIPGVKALYFGDALEMMYLPGSSCIDEIYNPYDEKNGNEILDDNTEKPQHIHKVFRISNHGGGIEGGVSNGEIIEFSTWFKPTASIPHKKQSVNLKTGQTVELSTQGRHDACIGLRGAVVVEAACALALLDALYEKGFIARSYFNEGIKRYAEHLS